MRIESNANFSVTLSKQGTHYHLLYCQHLNKSSSSVFRPALPNLWLLLVFTYAGCILGSWQHHVQITFKSSLWTGSGWKGLIAFWKGEPGSNWLRVKWPSGEREEMGEGWVGTPEARVAAPRATLNTLLSCSPNFPRASIPRYTYAKHEPILKLCMVLWDFVNKAFLMTMYS